MELKALSSLLNMISICSSGLDEIREGPSLSAQGRRTLHGRKDAHL